MFGWAREQAKALDQEFSKTGKLRGPLHGIPVNQILSLFMEHHLIYISSGQLQGSVYVRFGSWVDTILTSESSQDRRVRLYHRLLNLGQRSSGRKRRGDSSSSLPPSTLTDNFS
jgi:hypothetical protein